MSFVGKATFDSFSKSPIFGSPAEQPVVGQEINALGLNALNQRGAISSPLSNERIDTLINPDLITWKDCIYEGSLNIEKREICKRFHSSPVLQLADYIRRANQPVHDHHDLSILFVALGIKPCFVSESEVAPELFSLASQIPGIETFTDIRKLSPSDQLTQHAEFAPQASPLIEEDDEEFSPMEIDSSDSDELEEDLLEDMPDEVRCTFFRSTKPLDCFDPYIYIKPDPFVSEKDKLTYYYCNPPWLTEPIGSQTLSYLLGYGPSWEAFTLHGFLETLPNKPMPTNFTEQHSLELGKVIAPQLTKDQQIDIGLKYHQYFFKFRKKDPDNNIDFILDFLTQTGTSCVVDGITARTDYFKKNFTLKVWVMENFFPGLIKMNKEL